jgi:hypothetical protein
LKRAACVADARPVGYALNDVNDSAALLREVADLFWSFEGRLGNVSATGIGVIAMGCSHLK